MITATGATRWLVDRATVLSDEYGEPYLVQGVAYDVTERKSSEHENAQLLDRALTAVRERDEALALRDAVFANSPVGIALLDTDLRYVRVNPALAALQNPMRSDAPSTRCSLDLADRVRAAPAQGAQYRGVAVTNEISGRTPPTPSTTATS